MKDRVEPRLHRHEREEVAAMAFAIAHRVFAVPAQCQAHHGRFITMFRILSKDFRQEVASVAIA